MTLSVSLSEWHHIAVVHTRVRIVFFLDGVSIREEVNPTPPADFSASSSLWTGDTVYTPAAAFIADLRFWSDSAQPIDSAVAMLAKRPQLPSG